MSEAESNQEEDLEASEESDVVELHSDEPADGVKDDSTCYGRNAHCCAPPAQIRTWSLNHPAPTSGA